MRINKLMSNAGICSRKEANRYIEEGRIFVNGKRCTPGKWVEWTDDILLDGVQIKPLNKIYILMHKPKGITCTAEESVMDNIIDFLKYPQYIFPVGRLDKESEGLMLLTNDGVLADLVLAAELGHEKEYIVTVDQIVDEELMDKLSNGVEIFGQLTRPCPVKQIDAHSFSIILSQGLNRQIRKMCKKFGYNVTRLVRTRIVNLKLDGIELGAWRQGTETEINDLRKIIANSHKNL